MATAPVRVVEERRSVLRSERRFFLGAAVAAAMIVLTGFARTYYLKGYFHTPALLPIVHVHAVVFTSWLALFITQTWLVSARRTRVHMRLGIAGFVLALTMLAVGTATAITVAKLGHVRPGGPPPLYFLVVPIFDMAVFATLMAAGFLLRRRPDYHKRLMLVRTLTLMTAAFGRIVTVVQGHANVSLALTFTSVLVVIAATWDWALHRRLHPAFVWAGALVIVAHPLRLAVGHTETWMAFARWLTS